MEMGRQVSRGGVRPQGPAPHAIRSAVQGPGVARPPAPPALPAAVGSVRGRPAPRQALLPFAGLPQKGTVALRRRRSPRLHPSGSRRAGVLRGGILCRQISHRPQNGAEAAAAVSSVGAAIL